MEHAKKSCMMLELVNKVGGRKYLMRPNALGKVLDLARQEGWRAESLFNTDSCDTAIVLPHFGPFMPGRISGADAERLRIILTKALATGTVAAGGSDQTAANTLLQVARDGAFRVRLARPEASREPPSIAGELKA